MTGQDLGQPVDAVHPRRALPGQVVEPDVVELHPVGLDPEVVGEAALEPDRHVAQPDGPVTRLEQGAGDDADRVGEVDDPGVRGRGRHLLGDVEHDRDGAQRLGQTTGAGRLLTDAAAFERPGLVLVTRSLATDTQLEQHGVGAVQSRGQLGGRGQGRRVVEPLEDPSPEGAHQLEPRLVGIDQHQLFDRQRLLEPAEAVDQLRGVRRAAADDDDLRAGGAHPLTPVRVTPSMKAFWARKNSRITGAITITVAAMVRFQFVWWALLNDCSP